MRFATYQLCERAALRFPRRPVLPETGDGIDVSHHQGRINWGKVTASGILWAYVKLTEGVGYTDPRAEENLRGADAAGVAVGAYHFARLDSGTDAEDDARAEMRGFFLRSEGLPLSLAPAIDIELGGIQRKQSAAYCVRWLQAAVDETRNLWDAEPVIYTGYWTWRYMGRPDVFNDLALWQAHYGRRPPKLGDWAPKIHQYTATGHVPGIKGNVDRNRLVTGG